MSESVARVVFLSQWKFVKTGPDSLPWCQCTCKTKKSFGVNVLMTLFRTVGLSMSSHSVVPVISVACWSTVCVLICMHVCMYVCMYVRSTVCIYSMYFVVNQLWDKFFFFLIWIVQFHLVFFFKKFLKLQCHPKHVSSSCDINLDFTVILTVKQTKY